MVKPIYKCMDELPERNITTMVLNALDFVVPGQWQNIIGFDNLIRHTTGEDDPDLIKQIGERAIALYNDQSQGYQRAMWLYETVDSADNVLATAALANTVGAKIPLLSLVNRLTPSPDKAQSIDFAIKLTVELVAFCQINGIPGDSIGDFVGALADYGGESVMRIAALLCLDGLIPLGPDFLMKIEQEIKRMNPQELGNNPVFSQVSDLIPGGGIGGQLNFVSQAFDETKSWMKNFVSERNLTPENVFSHISQFIESADGRLDMVAAFLDMTTNYYAHTGTQTIAKRLIERAYAEI